MEPSIIRKYIIEALQMGIAVLMASIGLKAFLLPNGFLDGGVTGVAILLSNVFDIDISFVLPIVSAPFFLIAYFTVTKKTLVKSILAILVLSLAIYLENFSAITDDKLIIATFGGVFLGCGIGLAIRCGSVLDASELLGLYLNEKYGFSIAKIFLVFNVILFAVAAIIQTPEIAMYSILTYLITSKAIDFTIQGFENYVGLIIVSSKSQHIHESFIQNIGQGITIYKGVKGHGKSGPSEVNEIIHVVANRIDALRINSLISDIDNDAFVTEFDVNNVKGGKIRKLLKNEKALVT